METLKFKAIITGPEEYLPGGVKIDDFEITEQDVLEVIEEGESTESSFWKQTRLLLFTKNSLITSYRNERSTL